MMKAYEVVGFSYEASTHCSGCTCKRIVSGLRKGDIEVIDAEGNPIHPVFAGDEDADTETCDDCGEKLIQD